MTDVSITAANVVAVDNTNREVGIAGETITAGQALYKSSTTGKWMKADSNQSTEEQRKATGIALTGSSLNQPIVVHKGGTITIGGTLTAGVAYYLSDAAGGICPVADIGSGEYSCFLGMATTTAILDFAPKYSGVAL